MAKYFNSLIMVKCRMVGLISITIIGLMKGQSFAQICREPQPSDFKAVTLASGGMVEPIHLAVAADGRVFVAEMQSGKILINKPGQSGMITAGTIPTRYDNEDGLLGIALSPDFATNKHLYAIYSQPSDNPRGHEVARFTVNGDKLENRKVILTFPRVALGRYHAGGGMAFDSHGVLVIGTGDDTNPHEAPNNGYAPLYYKDPGKDGQKSAGNTNDLRGKILRFKPIEFADTESPTPGIGMTYEIPKGNLWEAISAADPNADQTKVRKEIFTMGSRNPFRVGIDTRTGWVFWGDVGPDAGGDDAGRGRMGHDEFNVATKSGNFGWPYVNGNQFVYNRVDYSSNDSGVSGSKFDVLAPENNSPNNNGLKILPPAQPPQIWYAGGNNVDWKEMGSGGETAMSGPMYRYSPSSASKVKFPPWFEGKIIFWDWSRSVYKTVALDEAGKFASIKDFEVSGLQWGSMISMQYGPEGALYVLKYSEGGYGNKKSELYRIEYTGTYDDACFKAFGPDNSPTGIGYKHPSQNLKGGIPGGFLKIPEGMHRIVGYSLMGESVFNEALPPEMKTFELPQTSDLVQVRFYP